MQRVRIDQFSAFASVRIDDDDTASDTINDVQLDYAPATVVKGKHPRDGEMGWTAAALAAMSSTGLVRLIED